MLLVERQEQAGQLAQFVEVQQPFITALRGALNLIFKQGRWQIGHGLAITGDQTPVGIPDQPRVAGLAQKPADGLVAQADVEQRFHHAGHGRRSAGAYRYDQRRARIAKNQPRRPFQAGQSGGEQRRQAGFRGGRVMRADHQRGRDGKPDACHAQQIEGFGAHGVAAWFVMLDRIAAGNQVKMCRPMTCRFHVDIPDLVNTIWRSA